MENMRKFNIVEIWFFQKIDKFDKEPADWLRRENYHQYEGMKKESLLQIVWV